MKKVYSKTIRGIEWFPLSGSQECSYRLGHKNTISPDMRGVCCQEVYDIAWEAVKEMMSVWNLMNRPPHWQEFGAAWKLEEVKEPFYNCPFFRDIVLAARRTIIHFYKVQLGRKPTSDEVMAALRQCSLRPGFRYTWNLKYGSKEYFRKNWGRARHRVSRKVKFCTMVEMGRCCVCDQPVYTYDGSSLKGAGVINMSFGYGSGRDLDYIEGYVHDVCSIKLERVLCKGKFRSNNDTRFSLDSIKKGRLILEKEG